MPDKIKINKFLKFWNIVIHLSWADIKARYARSVIGPFWLVLTTAISVAGLGYIWSILFNMNKSEFIPSLTIGLVIWQFIANCVSEAPNCFTHYGSIIKNYNLSIWIYTTALVVKNLIIFMHNMVIILIVLIIFPQNVGWENILIIPSLAALVLFLVNIVTVFALIGARFKDFGAAVTAFMSIAFFLSPVVFKPGQLGAKELLMWFNPFSYLISIIRDPIVGTTSGNHVYIVMALMTISIVFIAKMSGLRYQNRVPFWV